MPVSAALALTLGRSQFEMMIALTCLRSIAKAKGYAKGTAPLERIIAMNGFDP